MMKICDESPLVTVVIPNFNGKSFLKDLLSSLASQTNKDFEVIVIDNASSDNSVEYLKANFPWIRIIENKENRGFAGGTNRGIIEARGEYILTLNNDTIANRDFLDKLLEPMIEDRSIGMCASKMILPNGLIDSTGISISMSGAAYDRGMFEKDNGDRYIIREEIFGPCAGAALYRKKMLDQIGLFDEDFYLYMEDVDLAFRARLAGWRCFYVPEAKVYHYHGGTSGFRSDLCVYYGNRNIIWYITKNYSLKLLFFSLPLIVLRNLAAIPYYALRGQGKIVLLSKVHALQGIPLMFKKRRGIRRMASEKDILQFVRLFA